MLRRVSNVASGVFGFCWGLVFFIYSGIIRSGTVSLDSLLPAVPSALVFAILAVGMSWYSRRLGFNPLVIGLIWLTYELVSSAVTDRSHLLAYSQPLEGRNLRLVSTIGLSGLSFLIVLFNAILIRLWQWAAEKTRSRSSVDSRGLEPPVAGLQCIIPRTFEFFLPTKRGPPLHTQRQVGMAVRDELLLPRVS